MRLRRYSPSKQQSFSWKLSLNSCLIVFDQLYIGRAGRNSREKAFNKILSKISERVSGGVVTTKRPGVRKLPRSIPGRTCYFFFSSFLFFFFSFTFSLHFSYCSFLLFLCIAYVFFRFINFLPYCFTSLSTSCPSPESFARSCDSRISSWKVCFTQCTLFFPKTLFSIADLLPCVICGSYVTEINCVVTQRSANIRVAWLVYVRRHCLLIDSGDA